MARCSVILTSHALTQWNVDRKIQGHIDTPGTNPSLEREKALRKLKRSGGNIHYEMSGKAEAITCGGSARFTTWSAGLGW